MKHGIINIYKEQGFTSHDVVAVLRGVFKQKKIGHTGTLDPDATGVLPICLGKGTKVAGMITDYKKIYRTSFVLGSETDTQDASGEVIKECSYDVTDGQIMDVIKGFVGEIDQLPPMYSAIKVNGRKLYDLARAGQVIERKTRHITIHDVYDVEVELPLITMTVSCSKGTYIRTLCRDIAEKLGTCGHMTKLERLRSGQFDLSTALTLDHVKQLTLDQEIDGHIMAIDDFFGHYPRLTIKKSYDQLLINGNKMPFESIIEDVEVASDVRYNVYNQEGDYMGVYTKSSESKTIRPVKFFHIKKA